MGENSARPPGVDAGGIGISTKLNERERKPTNYVQQY
jgi:hypothetical protein